MIKMNAAVELVSGERKSIVAVFFACILIMLAPFIISEMVLKNENILMPLMTFGFLLQTFALILVLVRMDARIEKKSIIAILFLIVVQLATQIVLMNTSGRFEAYDIVNIFAKCVNYLLLFAILIGKQISEEEFILFIRCLVIYAVIACIYNMIAYRTEISELGSLSSSYEVNIKSFFNNRNQFAAFLAVAVIANTFLCIHRFKKGYILVYLLFFANLVFTMSRTALLAAGVFILAVLMLNTKRKAIKIAALGCVCVLGAVLLLGNFSFFNDMLLRADNLSTMSDRSGIWEEGMRIATGENIVSGVGYFSAQKIAIAQGMGQKQFHSLFVDTLVSGGIVELAFVGGVIGYVLARIVKSGMRPAYKKTYFAAYGALIILAIFESIGFFSIGYVDTFFTIFFISVPVVFSGTDRSRYCAGEGHGLLVKGED